jgi:uroporphyrinogen-III decarboxylase
MSLYLSFYPLSRAKAMNLKMPKTTCNLERWEHMINLTILILVCGGPWLGASYMNQGKHTKNYIQTMELQKQE